MKKVSLLLLMVVTAAAAWAVPARRGNITHTQKDGTEITLQLVGDEHFHYYKNVATGAKMERLSDGDFRIIDNVTLSERGKKAQEKRAQANADRIQRLPRMRQQAEGGPNKSIGSFSNMTGTKKGLVILVNFQDVTFKSANNQTAFYNQFNQSGYSSNSHIGSVKDYFSAQSYNTFTIDFDVVGPVTVSQNMAYYGANDSNDSDEHPAEMIIEAVKLANTECGVDYTQYDWGGDGYVDQVFIIYAGYNEAQGASTNTIWPHEWNLSNANYYGDGSGKQKIDGKYIDTYACTSELNGTSGSTMDGIGTACHEFSHCLGYPDLYDTAGNGCWGMDAFDLMDYGSYSGPNGRGEVPCGYSAYERWMAGWLTPIELTNPLTVTDMPALNDSPTAYIIYNPNKETEYLLLENRQNNNWFKYLRTYSTGHGLLVTHVDYNSTSWSNNAVNTDTSHERFKYIAADKAYSASNLPKDYFGSVSGVTSLTSSSHSSYGGKWFNGTTAFSNMDVTEISESNGKISFKFDGGLSDDGSRYTVKFYEHGNLVETFTQTSFRQPFTAPVISTSEFLDWVPMGWSLIDCTNVVSDLDIDYDENKSYVPTENMNLYAVYMNDDGDITGHPVETDNTVTLYVQGALYQTFTQTSETRKFELPTIVSTVPSWTFAGWATSSIEQTSDLPTLLTGGTQVYPSVDISYYAVFKSTVGSDGGAPMYRLVTSPTAGGEYLILNSNSAGSALALDADKITTTAATTVAGTTVTVVNNSGVAVSGASEELIWKATYTNGKWQFMNGEDYLCVNGSGFATKTSSSDLYWNDNYGLYGKSSSGNTSYYIQSDATSFKKVQSGNATNRVYLYANTDGSSVTYYNSNPVAPNFTVTFDAGTNGSCSQASFTQTNEIKSVTLPAASTTQDGWSFAGWATLPVSEMTTEAPSLLTADTTYEPTYTLTLYAVYQASTYTGAVLNTYYMSNPATTLSDLFYTVTLSNGSDTLGSWTQSAGNGTYTLPSKEYEGWTFFGWANSVVEQTEEEPSVMAAGSEYTPTANVTFYSVFKNTKAYISNPANYVPGGGVADPMFCFPHIAYVGKTFVAPTFHTDSDGALTYTSSNTEVAVVDGRTGAISAISAGYAIITVTQAATDTYRGATASYMIKVVAE